MLEIAVHDTVFPHAGPPQQYFGMSNPKAIAGSDSPVDWIQLSAHVPLGDFVTPFLFR